ncbi:sigma-70 family RNA polymerase sigma factor [Pseudonocardia sp. RS11V-5]|uniref:sigma-70 family RNA polymerase sigma factor n=1 Tax=Pseudonocardia terrae TaxID=2905831 RepID=UPI001E445972|nr:sigma-70 family RNA polymerase sigma factor [Pseudonocardia terrae]MCE3551801.1 sigma-70 family RNA polymerase sigma factor [Pseudonocardia terrae]
MAAAITREEPGQRREGAQETYLRAFTALPRFAADAPARLWLLSIARRVAADDVRRARRRPRADAVAEWEDLGGLPGLAQRSAEGEVLLRAVVAALDPERREAFVLTQMLDLGYGEAAEVCGCPIGTIRSRVSRAREDLAAALEVRPRRRREA